MKKLIVLLTVVVICLSSCSLYRLEKPYDFDFDYWLLDMVEYSDFDGRFDRDFGLMGARAYYAEGYKLSYGTFPEGDTYPIDPEHYVQYIVGGYPDRLGPRTAVIGTRITDPKISVWGLTINSTYEEFSEVMKDLGFRIPKNSKGVAKRGRYEIHLLQGQWISVQYNRTNFLLVVS